MGQSEEVKKSIGRISTLLLLLIHGQEKDVELYELLSTLLKGIAEYESKSDIEMYEIYVVVRVLHRLGYFDERFTDPIPETLFDEALPDVLDLEHIADKKLTYIEYINKCIHESQL